MSESELPRAVEIEVLYFEGCPSWSHVVGVLEELAREGVPVQVRTVAITSPEDAERLTFPGSPTLRVGGRDLFPGPDVARPGLGCRVYRTPEGLRGWPTKGQIAGALRRAGAPR